MIDSHAFRTTALLTLLLGLFVLGSSLPAEEPHSAWRPLAEPGQATDWPQWRGPAGDGTSQQTDLPTEWGPTQNIHWKRELESWGDSTPVVQGDTIYVTAQTDEGGLRLYLLDRASGNMRKQVDFGPAETPREAAKRSTQKFHRLHNLASPSPVAWEDGVVVHYGNGLLACLNRDGEELWNRNLQEEYGAYSIWWGHANSPVVFEDLVISVCMQDPLDDVRDEAVESYLVAHDLKSGELRWKSSRMTGAPAEQADAYTTPIFVTNGKQIQMLVMGGNQLDAYDPQTGKQLWYLPGLEGGRTVTGPVAGDGMVFTTRGMRGPLLGIELGAHQGEVSAKAIRWEVDRGTPDTPSPVLAGGLLFTVTDDGIAHCYDAKSGELHWRERLGGNFKASPIAADGHIYFMSTDSKCHVVQVADTFERVAENELGDETLSSIAITGNQLLIRGKQAIYCVGE
ncbi:MAG: PQQ-binding-like beta-propeller repeat protein [Pirellulaceae bacterium]